MKTCKDFRLKRAQPREGCGRIPILHCLGSGVRSGGNEIAESVEAEFSPVGDVRVSYQNPRRASTTITRVHPTGRQMSVERIGSGRSGTNAVGLFAGSQLRQMDGNRLTGGFLGWENGVTPVGKPSEQGSGLGYG